jgi:hypothetical protein
MSQFNLDHAFTPYSFEIYFNIILPFTLTFLQWVLPLILSDQNCAYVSISARLVCVTCPAHLVFLATRYVIISILLLLSVF